VISRDKYLLLFGTKVVVMEIPESVRDDLESRANVVGTCLGERRVNGQPTGEEVVIVLVSRKHPSDRINNEDLIPETVKIDGQDAKTDVQEIGEPRIQAVETQPVERRPDRTRRWRPAPAGVSFGHPETTAGTLGSPPLLDEKGNTVVLTNAHIGAPIGVASKGDPVYQPGPADGGTEEDTLGELREWSEISQTEPNTTDSALVTVDREVMKNTILEIGPLVGIEDDTPNMRATHTKSGRTTGVTTGDQRGYDARVKVRGYYDEPVVFEGVGVFSPMSAGGDSGSLIGIERDDGFHATHLLFAGSDRTTLGIPLSAVQDEHGVLKPVKTTQSVRSFHEQVRRALVDGYGPSAVTNGDDNGPDFLVTTPFVRLAVVVAGIDGTETTVSSAVGQALVHASDQRDLVPLVVYPADEHNTPNALDSSDTSDISNASAASDLPAAFDALGAYVAFAPLSRSE
jgi:hypothetical protein